MFLFALAFLLVGHFGRVIFSAGQTYPAVVLAPNGIALAALIKYGGKKWKYIMGAAMLNALFNGLLPGGAFIASVLYVLQASVGAWAFHALNLDQRFSHLRDTLWFSGIALLTSAIVPIGGMFLLSLSTAPNNTTFFYWWLGSIVSALVFTPLLVRGLSEQRPAASPAKGFEIALAFSLLITVDFFFWTKYPTEATLPFVLLQLGMFTWIALRMGMSYMSWATFISSVIFLCAPFYGFDRPSADQLSLRIISTEVYMCIFAILFYFLSSAFEERNEAFTSLKEKIEELEHSNQRILQEDLKKTEFIAVLAHELRNPLAPIANNLSWMELEGIQETKYKNPIDGITKQVRHISRLLEDLLDVSRINQGKIELRKQPLDLHQSIRYAIDSVRPFVQARDLEVTLDLHPGPLWVSADPLRLEQIVINLLNNAAKYTNPKGRIRISTSIGGGTAILQISDNGIGICPEMLPKIFDSFIQADNSITRTFGGLGIGLKLVRTLAELHGGTIQAESDGLDKGSRFTLKLPLGVPPQESGSIAQEPSAAALLNSSNKKILVVDDNKDVVYSLGEVLRLLGHEVLKAYDGEQALSIALTHRPAIVLLDIGLPDITGYEVAKSLRETFGSGVTLIAISGYGQAEDKLRAKQAGFDQHLTKPVSMADIKEAIKVL